MSTEKTYGYIDYDYSHHRLFVHHYCRALAEREEWGRGCGFWRHGQPDRIWSAGGGQRAVQSNYLVGDHFYGHLNYAFDRGFAKERSRLGAPGIETFRDKISASYSGAAARATAYSEVAGVSSQILRPRNLVLSHLSQFSAQNVKASVASYDP